MMTARFRPALCTFLTPCPKAFSRRRASDAPTFTNSFPAAIWRKIHLSDTVAIILAPGLLVYFAANFRHSLALQIRRDGLSVETRPEITATDNQAIRTRSQDEEMLQDDFRRHQ